MTMLREARVRTPLAKETQQEEERCHDDEGDYRGGDEGKKRRECGGNSVRKRENEKYAGEPGGGNRSDCACTEAIVHAAGMREQESARYRSHEIGEAQYLPGYVQ